MSGYEQPSHEAYYIGDGVYVTFDGYQLWVWAERANGWHRVALEPAVLRELNDYAQRTMLAEPSFPDRSERF